MKPGEQLPSLAQLAGALGVTSINVDYRDGTATVILAGVAYETHECRPVEHVTAGHVRVWVCCRRFGDGAPCGNGWTGNRPIMGTSTHAYRVPADGTVPAGVGAVER